MPQLNTIVATTELEAVNQMLAAIGENPITDLDAAISAGDTQIEMAVNILRSIMREVQLFGWRFNTEQQFRIANTTVETEEGFSVPTNLLRFDVTQRSDQCGPRPEKQEDGTYSQYPRLLDIEVGSKTPLGVLRFIDRLTGSRVIAAADRAQIFIDAVFSRDFDQTPESFRNYVVKRSAREFAEETIGEPEVAGFTENDIRAAWRNLKKDQSNDKDRNLITTSRAFNFVGRRPRRFG